MTHDDTNHKNGHDVTTEGVPSTSVDDGDVSALERTLTRRNEPFVRATVVRREPPASANVGDRAIVTADGEIHGWVGGAACAQRVVSSAATDVLESNKPQLIGIAPDPETIDRHGLDAYRMTCQSDGLLELFLEPVTPTATLVIVGDSPVAQSLARLASELTLDVTLVVDEKPADLAVPDDTSVLTDADSEAIVEAVGPDPIVVVASMGKYDARGIAAGILAGSVYVGLVASDERAESDIERAAQRIDYDFETVDEAVTNPAGVSIEAYTPAELAISLLAEVVDVRSRLTESTTSRVGDDEEGGVSNRADVEGGGVGEQADVEKDIDPVCGMSVQPSSAAATAVHDGNTYYFCCRGCADSFAEDPASYLESNPGGNP